MTSPLTARRLALLGLAIAAWLVCFAILRRLGTWLPFALIGPALAVLTLASDVAARRLLRPSLGKVAVGMAAGLLMVGLTHAAFAIVVSLRPEVLPATERLYALLNVAGFSPAGRAGLIVVVASCEEIIFRGALLGPPPATRPPGLLHGPQRGDATRVVASAVGYALATATLGSTLLIACALACALLWGGLRVATRSLTAPIIAHAVWDLGVLVLWPLAHVN